MFSISVHLQIPLMITIYYLAFSIFSNHAVNVFTYCYKTYFLKCNLKIVWHALKSLNVCNLSLLHTRSVCLLCKKKRILYKAYSSMSPAIESTLSWQQQMQSSIFMYCNFQSDTVQYLEVV